VPFKHLQIAAIILSQSSNKPIFAEFICSCTCGYDNSLCVQLQLVDHATVWCCRCAFPNTPKFQQVWGKGHIVRKEWIENCHSKRTRLPWRRLVSQTLAVLCVRVELMKIYIFLTMMPRLVNGYQHVKGAFCPHVKCQCHSLFAWTIKVEIASFCEMSVTTYL
jgi:hypothetical protein